MMLHEKITQILLALGAVELGVGMETLTAQSLEHFAHQIAKYDRETLAKQKEALLHKQPSFLPFEPLEHYFKAGNRVFAEQGIKAIKAGKLGCIILAGGQGSRLGASVPKGTIPVSHVRGKSCFQIFCEKALAASTLAGRELSLAIMTSALNHDATLQFLKENNWFGLKKSQIALFQQRSLPFLNDQGDLLLETPGKIAEGPDGNGGAFHRFVEVGLWEQWKNAGIEHIHVIPVDNPLADPFDAELLGMQIAQENEASMKAVLRENAEEKVGVIVQSEGTIHIAEYFEIPPEQSHARRADGMLLYSLANINQFCFRMDFIHKIAQRPYCVLPFHFAHKKARIWEGSHQTEKMIWKCETFLFDLLRDSARTGVIVYPRESCYSPLKNASGDRSIETVKHALQERDRAIFQAITHCEPPHRPFELDQAFYYPTAELLNKWHGRSLPDQEYIRP